MRKLLALLLLLGNTAFAQSFTKTQVCYGINYGVAFDIAPDGRYFVTEKGVSSIGLPAQIKVYDVNGFFLSVFYDLSDSTFGGGEAGLLGITLDPNFSSNHFVYVFHTCPGDTSVSGYEHIKIRRFTEINSVGTQPVVIFDYELQGLTPFIHIGGNIHFRPSDSTHLYVSIGDFGTGYIDSTPALTDNPIGKFLRISKYPNSPPPNDNPFYDDGNPLTGNCDWIWSYGHRNAFDFCFGPNDSLYSGENGTQLHDEVNIITRGGFYGWPYCEGPVDMDTASLPCHAPGAINPFIDFPGPPLPALTGIVFYTDSLFGRQKNHLIAADYNHADLIDIPLSNPPEYNVAGTPVTWIDASDSYGISDLMQGPDGCLYYLLITDSVFGGIYKLCPVPDSTWMLSAGPNPFFEETTISMNVGKTSVVNVSLYDIRGRLVETLIDGEIHQGYHAVQLNAQISSLLPGIYICVLRSEDFVSAVKLVVQ